MRNATQAMIDQRIGLADWQRSMATDLRGLHIQNGHLGDGLRNPTDADRAVLQDGLRFQFQHLGRVRWRHRLRQPVTGADARTSELICAVGPVGLLVQQHRDTARADGMTEERA